MSSIADQLASLINPNPSFDPEDDIYEDTKAKLIDKDLIQNESGLATGTEKSVGRKTLRRMHDDDDPRYTGKVISRKDVESDVDSSDNGLFGGFVSSDEDNESLNLDDPESDDEIGVNEKEDDNDEVNSDADADDEVNSDDAMGSSDEEKYSPTVFQKKKSGASEESKGKDTLNQINLWESLLETRIKLQKLLSLANQLPRPSTYEEFVDQSDAGDSIGAATKSLTILGSTMHQLQSHLVKLLQEDADSNESEETTSQKHTERVFDKERWNERIAKRCDHLRKHRNETLKYWYDKTRLTAGKANDKSFSSFERPTVAQIEHILADRDRLIRRTRLQRSDYRILGSSNNKVEPDTDSKVHDAHLKQTDEEIFDDDDFYQQLLRQFIEQKTAGGGSDAQTSAEMTRNWLKLQHLKTKTRKIVDTKASKGRKVRYDVHSKLVSFMAPSDKSTWNHESRNQLVKSIFGKSMICSNDIGDK